MSLIKRPRPTTYIGGDELHGTINVLINRVDELPNDDSLIPYYIGAAYALEIIEEQDYVQFPADFLGLFELKINGNLAGRITNLCRDCYMHHDGICTFGNDEKDVDGSAEMCERGCPF